MSPLPPESLADLDEALASAAGAHAVPAVQAALLLRGEPVWTGTYGIADTEAGAPVTDRTLFCLASLGKTLVATIALRLVEDGRLDLDAPVAGVVPEVPGADVVTARMLLAHTAGYPEIYTTPELAPLFPHDAGEDGGEEIPADAGSAYDPDRVFTWPMLLPGFRPPVDPGGHWAYSNGGYILLTELLVRILGGPDGLASAWADLAERAGVPDADLVLDRELAPRDRLAHGYDLGDDSRPVDVYAAHPPADVPTDLFGLPFGDGLFAGTAEAVGRFLDALFVREVLLAPATLDTMTATTPPAAAADLPDHPDLTTYALGTFRVGTDGAWQGHSGTYGGFTALGASRREGGETLAVLANLEGRPHTATAIWQAIAARVDDVRAAGAAG